MGDEERVSLRTPSALTGSVARLASLEKRRSQVFGLSDRQTAWHSDAPIVVHSHLRWSFVWQRPQQIHSRLALNHPILFVEEPVRAESGHSRLELSRVAPNILVAEPRIAEDFWSSREEVEARVLALLREAAQPGGAAANFRNAIHWVYTPQMEPQIAAFGLPVAVVYDCMDELTHFAFAPPELFEREQRLLARADVVFTGGTELFLAKSRLHKNVHAFGCGVDFEHFSSAGAVEDLPPDIARLPRPRLGYIGVLDERLDYALINCLAEENPEGTVVLVGPVVKVDASRLPRADNLVYLGARPYSTLPAYLAGFDVCLMPFALNAASKYINPTKTLEYLASGKPVVSTPVRDVERNFSEVVHIASAPEFSARVREVLSGGRLDPARGLDLARHSSWDETVSEMERLVRKTVRLRERGRSPRLFRGEVTA